MTRKYVSVSTLLVICALNSRHLVLVTDVQIQICTFVQQNDIQPWKWTGLLDVFNPTGAVPSASFLIETRHELLELLKNPDFRKADRIQLVEVKLGKEDAPLRLKIQASHVSEVLLSPFGAFFYADSHVTVARDWMKTV